MRRKINFGPRLLYVKLFGLKNIVLKRIPINFYGISSTSISLMKFSLSTALCLKFFKAVGVEISCYDIDIGHRVPKRNAIPGPRPIVCKFTRRIIREQVMNNRNDAFKVTATSVGIPADCSSSSSCRCQEISKSEWRQILLGKELCRLSA